MIVLAVALACVSAAFALLYRRLRQLDRQVSDLRVQIATEAVLRVAEKGTLPSVESAPTCGRQHLRLIKGGDGQSCTAKRALWTPSRRRLAAGAAATAACGTILTFLPFSKKAPPPLSPGDSPSLEGDQPVGEKPTVRRHPLPPSGSASPAPTRAPSRTVTPPQPPLSIPSAVGSQPDGRTRYPPGRERRRGNGGREAVPPGLSRTPKGQMR